MKGDNTLPVTHKEMTRFWLTLDEGVNFSIKSMELMKGGEIFIPKLPSVESLILPDLLKNIKLKEVGIRPGEKIHEIMCPSDDSHRTIEFKKYFVITPTILLRLKIKDYLLSKNKEKGKMVNPGFEYSSETNKNFLNTKQISKINDLVLK